jgi:hypothetical protein
MTTATTSSPPLLRFWYAAGGGYTSTNSVHRSAIASSLFTPTKNRSLSGSCVLSVFITEKWSVAFLKTDG